MHVLSLCITLLTNPQLFRGEFIFPTEGLDVNLAKTLETLENENIIKVTRNADDPNKVESVELSDAEREKGRENFDFYCFLIWPFIEASWLGAMSLMMLTPPVGRRGEHWLDLKKVQDRAQLVRYLTLTPISYCISQYISTRY